jgi:BirA family biotin operon repressor/biotin-[acetyl-CoA-carboxylase] ligase
MEHLAGPRLAAWEQEIAAALPSWWRIECYTELTSTMDRAREIPGAVGEPGLVLAERQFHGRGRQGRAWVAPARGFLGTFVFTTAKPIADLGGFSLAAGIAVCDVLRELDCPVGLKWPNDVLSERGGKIAGILVELVARGAETVVLTGIGVNLAGEPAAVEDVTSVETLSGRAIEVPTFSARLAVALWDIWSLFESRGLDSVRRRWLESALYLGRILAVDTGQETVRGVFTGIDAIGRLVLDVDGKAQVVAAGHIVERPGGA